MPTSSTGWTAGVVHLGPPPPLRSDTPLHRATVTTTVVAEYVDHYRTAREALDARVKRLREAGTPHEIDGMTVRFTEGAGTTTITYEEA
jgi:hypothetical protein